jgi:hypothetical protein
MQRRSNLFAIAVVLVAWMGSGGTAPVAAQVEVDQWPNAPQPNAGRQIVPFMEGWYDNGDGTFTISFGYLNRNPTEPHDIALGERNYIEPAKYDGVQPTHFLGSRQRGMFAITIPASERDQDIWWHLVDSQGRDYKVPGRTNASAYQLDWNARPHGSLPPLVWFDSERNAKQGPEGVQAPRTLTARVGQPVTVEVSTRDPSVRDVSDRRFAEALPVRVIFSKYSGPEGALTFERDPSMPAPAEPAGGRGRVAPPEEIMLDGVAGAARVRVTFPAPGDYVILAQADNWRAPDSSAGDQCCWSNAYQRVTVTP